MIEINGTNLEGTDGKVYRVVYKAYLGADPIKTLFVSADSARMLKDKIMQAAMRSLEQDIDQAMDEVFCCYSPVTQYKECVWTAEGHEAL